MCFGRPKAKNMPPIKDKLDTLIEYAMCVRNICATMECCQMQSHLNNPLLVKELVDKLPNNHKLTWAMYYKDDRVPIIKSFSDWLYYKAEAASNVTPLFVKNGASVNTHNRDEESKESSGNEINKIALSTTCIVCNDGSHKVVQCDVFKSMSLNRKWKCVKAKNLCRQCLGRHRHKCNINKECRIDGCKYKHNLLLHKIVNVQNTTSSAAQSDQQNTVLNATTTLYSTHKYTCSKQIKNVYEFLDEELGLKGNSEPLCLRWSGDNTRHRQQLLYRVIPT